MKTIKTTMCIFLALCLMIFGVFESSNVYAASIRNVYNEENEQQSLNEYMNLVTYFEETYSKDLKSYPNYFGGAYLNKDKDLVVVVVNASTDEITQIKKITGNPNILIQEGTISYNELVQLHKDIFDLFISLNEEYKGKKEDAPEDALQFINNFIGVGISQRNNSIVINVKDDSKSVCSSILNFFENRDNIYFEKRDNTSEDTTYKPGRYISTSNGNGGSIGFRCSMTISGVTKKGFVTAGHVTGNSAYTYIYDGTGNQIGELQAYSYTNSSNTNNVDVAFVALINSSDGMDTQAHNGATLSDNYFTSLVEGQTVTMSGSSSSDSGDIVNTSYSYTSNSGVYLYDIVRCDYSGSNGDSGGVVYSNINGSNAIVGIHHGRLGFFQGYDSLVIKASNIYSAFSGIGGY